MVKAAAERANAFLARHNAVVDGATLEHVAALWEMVAAAARDASALYQELLLSDAPETAKAGIAAVGIPTRRVSLCGVPHTGAFDRRAFCHD
jgi:hypothetical protein